MRFARSDMRDHIVSHKNDHGASYRRYRVLQWRSRLKINFCEIFSVVRFSTFATLSAMSGPSDRAILIEPCSPLPSIKVFSANVPPWRHVCPYWIDRAQIRPMWSGPLAETGQGRTGPTGLRLQRKTMPREVIMCPSAAPRCGREHPTIPLPGHRALTR